MGDARVHLLDLPFDVLAILFTHLDPKDFLALSSTCLALHEHNEDLDFWRSATQATFRLPNRPSAQYDGARWKNLYRRLLHQTQIFLWGQQKRTRDILNGRNDLLHMNIFPYPLAEYPLSKHAGAIVDMQIGGWATTILDSTGVLYTSGPLNSGNNFEIGSDRFEPLQYPSSTPIKSEPVKPNTPPAASASLPNPGPLPGSLPGSVPLQIANLERRRLIRPPRAIYRPRSTANVEPSPPEVDDSTRIWSFSSGRSHVIALADDGTTWLWHRASKPAVKIQFPDIGEAEIESVSAGFSHSSVLVRHWGIIVWDYANKYREIQANAKTWDIPSSSDWSVLIPNSAGSKEMGNTTKHIVLENYVLFITDKGRLFCSNFNAAAVFEIPDITNVIDIQGSFRSFGVFQKGGAIVVAQQSFLEECEFRAGNPRLQHDIRLPVLIPALQNSGVVQLAFGDYHYHALHSNGRITSYGKQPTASGALGLSGIKSQSATKIRGVRIRSNEGTLLPHAYFTGRSVWFSEAKHKWISALTAALDSQPIDDEVKLGELSEWVEQRGSDWEDIADIGTLNADGLGTHFALSVAAGGWSSGALLLVNEELDAQIDKLCTPPQLEKLPNIKLSNGNFLLPGEEEYPWKKEPPVFNIKPGQGQTWGVQGWVFTDDKQTEES
jgi:SCF-associated factor 1